MDRRSVSAAGVRLGRRRAEEGRPTTQMRGGRAPGALRFAALRLVFFGTSKPPRSCGIPCGGHASVPSRVPPRAAAERWEPSQVCCSALRPRSVGGPPLGPVSVEGGDAVEDLGLVHAVGASGSCGNTVWSNSVERSTSAPWRRANASKRRLLAALSSVIVVSRHVAAPAVPARWSSASSMRPASPWPRCRRRDRDLPHHECVRLVGPAIAGHEADDPVAVGDDRRSGEVPAPEQVGVGGVHVEHLGGLRKRPERGTVGDAPVVAARPRCFGGGGQEAGATSARAPIAAG